MTNIPDSGTAPDDSPQPAKPLKPKRGAFPTPKSEIENAEPYIPDTDEKDGPEEKSDRPTDVDGKKEG